jgi:hypothetical protein
MEKTSAVHGPPSAAKTGQRIKRIKSNDGWKKTSAVHGPPSAAKTGQRIKRIKSNDGWKKRPQSTVRRPPLKQVNGLNG